MNFKSILDKVFEKIKNTKEKDKKRKAFNTLFERIEKNNIYKHQFEVLSLLEDQKGKIKNNAQLENFILKIRNKNFKFIIENKVTSLKVWQENKKLLEYYNINPGDIIPSNLDKAIDINADKKLNEAAIKTYFGKLDNTERVKKVSNKSQHLKEAFKSILKNKSEKDLTTNFKIVRFFAEALNKKHKLYIFESLSKLRSMQKENFTETVDKLYKLRLVTEKLIKEFQTDEYEDEEDDDELKTPWHSAAKKVTLKDLEFIQHIVVEAPRNYKDPEKLIIHFDIPFYPVGARYSELSDSALDIKKRLERLERAFINLFIYQKDRTKYFDPKGSIWQVIMRETGIKIGKPQYGKVKLFLNAKPGNGNSWEDYYTVVYKMLNEFQGLLQETFSDELTPELQKQAIDNIDTTRQRAKKVARNVDQIGRGLKNSVKDDDFGDYF